MATGNYRNLFREYLGKSDAEVKAKLDAAWRHFFAGDPDSQRLYYEVDGDMAYVPDINNNDVRSEGLSYGMMIAVQMNRKTEFDRIWRYAKHYMWHPDGPFAGYFAWHTSYDGKRLSNGPAPDGEEWFVTALFFAAHRWGSGEGVLNYAAEAQALIRAMLHKHKQPNRGPVSDMFDRKEKQIVFVPTPPGNGFTDPSYHVPAFTELWARWAAEPEDRALHGRGHAGQPRLLQEGRASPHRADVGLRTLRRASLRLQRTRGLPLRCLAHALQPRPRLVVVGRRSVVDRTIQPRADLPRLARRPGAVVVQGRRHADSPPAPTRRA